MKISIKEGIKRVSLIEEKINLLLDTENAEHYVVYQELETPDKGTYDFDSTQKVLNEYQDSIAKIKSAINYANATVKTDYEGLTIGEALVQLAQKNHNLNRLKRLSYGQQKSRKTTFNAVIEYTEKLYDIQKVKAMTISEKDKIHQLQSAIDKANILTEIEI